MLLFNPPILQVTPNATAPNQLAVQLIVGFKNTMDVALAPQAILAEQAHSVY